MVSRRLLTPVTAPLLALLVVSILSLAARSLFLDEPCMSPCTQAAQHTLIFDEAYYVNAARVIAGIRPPPGSHYADAPLGTDPNAEHPQGAKLIMAAAIDLFGDGPFAWRIGSLLMGSVAIVGMFALMRSAGAGRGTAVGAAALMAADNLLLVMGRIGTLDIYVVAAMIWAVALYVRGRPVAAGIALAVATCFKEVAPYALFVVLLVELGRLGVARRDRTAPADWRLGAAVSRLAAATFTTCGMFVGLLALMGEIATPYADSEAKLITGGPFAEISHIITYASGLTSPHGPTGIASYPWLWLVDIKPILYLRINPSLPGHGLNAIHPVVAFYGMISPPILLVGMPGLVFCAYRLLRRGRREGRFWKADREVPILAIAWFIGTWLPFALQSLIDQRTSYLYYMVIVMPGIYAAASYVVVLAWRRRTWLSALTVVWGLGVLVAVVLMYPFVAVF